MYLYIRLPTITLFVTTICSCCTIVNISPVQLSLYVCIQLKNDLSRDATAYMHGTIPNEHVDLGGHYFVRAIPSKRANQPGAGSSMAVLWNLSIPDILDKAS